MKHEAFQTEKALGLFHREADGAVPESTPEENTTPTGLDGSRIGP